MIFFRPWVFLYLKHAAPYEDAKPGVVAAIQSFGDFLDFHPHLHVISSDGCFYGEGSFMVSPTPRCNNLNLLTLHTFVFKFSPPAGMAANRLICTK